MPSGPSFHYRFVQGSKPIIFSILEFIRCSVTHRRPTSEYQSARTAKPPARAQLGPRLTRRATYGLSFLLLYPLAQGDHLSLLL